MIKMNAATLIVLAVVVLVIAGAVYGCYRTLRTESCCGSGKDCCCDENRHCTIKKGQ